MWRFKKSEVTNEGESDEVLFSSIQLFCSFCSPVEIIKLYIMCFSTTFDESCLEQLDQFIFDNIRYEEYTGGCWVISDIVRAITGIPTKCIGLINPVRGGCVPHWVNLKQNNGVVDLKRRCWPHKTRLKPILPSWLLSDDDGVMSFHPEGRQYSDVDANGNLLAENGEWAPGQYAKYCSFVEGNTFADFEECSASTFNRVTDLWFRTAIPC